MNAIKREVTVWKLNTLVSAWILLQRNNAINFSENCLSSEWLLGIVRKLENIIDLTVNKFKTQIWKKKKISYLL